MRRLLSLLVFCSAVGSSIGGLAADSSPDPSRTKVPLTGEGVLSEPNKAASPPAEVEESPRGGKLQLQTTAEPLEDEQDNQENIISQVSH